MDDNGSKWVATHNGLAKYDSIDWTAYHIGNSGIGSQLIYSLAIDRRGNKWIGTSDGLAVYREGGVIVSVRDQEMRGLPERFSLYQNYPNPFNSSTTITFDLRVNDRVSLKIFNTRGEEVETLVNERIGPGVFNIRWNETELPSGIYYCKLAIGEAVAVKKMIMMN